MCLRRACFLVRRLAILCFLRTCLARLLHTLIHIGPRRVGQRWTRRANAALDLLLPFLAFLRHDALNLVVFAFDQVLIARGPEKARHRGQRTRCGATVVRRERGVVGRDVDIALRRIDEAAAGVDLVIGAGVAFAAALRDHLGFVVGAAYAYRGGGRVDRVGFGVVFADPAGDRAHAAD